jgi:hypothetical protein
MERMSPKDSVLDKKKTKRHTLTKETMDNSDDQLKESPESYCTT